MSYDISIWREDDEGKTIEVSYADLNWLRNPFGLCDWAEDNAGVEGDPLALWHVMNDNSYDEVKDLDRANLQKVVLQYWERIQKLEKAYFHFTFSSYVQIAHSHREMIVDYADRGDSHIWIVDESGTRLAIDIDRFRFARNFSWSNQNISVLEFYKEWFKRLVDMAERMQNPEVKVSISS